MNRDQSPGALRRRAYEARVNRMMTKLLNFGKKLGIKITPGFMDIFCQVMYGVVFSGVVYVGIWDVLTFLYSDFGWLRTTQTIGWFLTLEIVVNWLCIKYVDSSYKPALHGGKPLYESNQSLVSMATNVDGDDVANVNNMNVPHSFSSENKNNTNNASSAKKRKNVFVAVALPNKDGHVKREEFDYWSWTPCVVCRRPRPPRCHHCSLCRKCVLKRDHHCFFAGSCVGVNNQRYFIVFLFWAFLGCVYAFLHMVYYFYVRLFPLSSIVDLFPPVALIRAICGYQTFAVFCTIFLVWGLAFFIIFSYSHLEESFIMVLKSQTSFEKSSSIVVFDTRTKWDRIRAVLGNYWILSFLLPCHWFLKPVEDAVLWPTIVGYSSN